MKKPDRSRRKEETKGEEKREILTGEAGVVGGRRGGRVPRMMGPHGIGGGRAPGDRWPRMVVGQLGGAVLVLGGELHGRVRIAHGGHA